MSRDTSRASVAASLGWVVLFVFATVSATEAGIIFFADGQGIAHKPSGGTAIAFPDVTYVPCPLPCNAGQPIPFPNVGQSADGTKTYKTKIPTTKTSAQGESTKLGIPYDVFLPADEFGMARIYVADPLTGLSFGPDYELLLKETSAGQFIVDLTSLPFRYADIIVELTLRDGGSEPDTRLLIPFLEGVGLTSVPEPSALLLLGAALLGLAGFRAGARWRSRARRGAPQDEGK